MTKISGVYKIVNIVTVMLAALAKRFQRAGIDHPVSEAKKYLLAE